MVKAENIHTAYIDWVTEKGRRPGSVRQFAREAGLDPVEVGAKYPRILKIEQEIMVDKFLETVTLMKEEPIWVEYTAREKMLALFYTWLQQIEPLKDFLRIVHRQIELPFISESWLKPTHEAFKEMVTEILSEGEETGEIAGRYFLNNTYDEVAWWQLRFILAQWLGDHTEDGEHTDAAVEKMVNFWFDLIQPNSLDSGIDLIKFLLQPAQEKDGQE